MATKAQKKIVGERLIYVSWREEHPKKLAWKDEFFLRVQAETGALAGNFKPPLNTASVPAGAESTEKDAWLSSLGARGGKSIRENRITDVVGVVTTKYISENAVQNATGELARMLPAILQDRDKADRVRVWLAPVDPPNWRNYRICAVALSDPNGEHRSWLVRLREKDRYPWPDDPGGKWSDEIAKAVATIIDKPNPN